MGAGVDVLIGIGKKDLFKSSLDSAYLRCVVPISSTGFRVRHTTSSRLQKCQVSGERVTRYVDPSNSMDPANVRWIPQGVGNLIDALDSAPGFARYGLDSYTNLV